MTETIPPIPPNAPQFGGNFMRACGRFGLRILGWRLAGEIPNLPKVVLIGAPHTSNWDFVLAMLCGMATGVKFSYLMKKEAFFWPFRSFFLYLGGIPIDRKSTNDIVPQLGQWFKTHQKVWLAITPEGTRSDVRRWKTGAVRIAWEAKAPLVLVAWDQSSKTMHIGKTWQPTGNFEEDIETIRSYVSSKYTK